MNVLDWFKRNSDRRRGKPEPPEDPLKHYGPFNPFGDPPGTGPFAEAKKWTEGPCLRCGEYSTRNSLMFCMPCWVFATDLARWSVEKRQEQGKTNYQEGDTVEVNVAQWAYVYTAKFPRDPGPDPKAPTFPDTITPVGSYWQPEGPKPDNTGRIRGICSCHFFTWN